jgi:uncharacterized protein
MKQTILRAILVFLCIPVAAAQVTDSTTNDAPATKDEIQNLFDVMQVRQQSHRMIDSLRQQMQAMSAQTIKARYPQISAAELARATRISEESLKDIPLDEILNDTIPIYQKHLTHTDVNAMIAFYSSPTGKKLMQEMPAITQEAMQVSYKRMQKQIDAVMQRVEDSVKEDQPKQQKPTTGQSPPPKPN